MRGRCVCLVCMCIHDTHIRGVYVKLIHNVQKVAHVPISMFQLPFPGSTTFMLNLQRVTYLLPSSRSTMLLFPSPKSRQQHILWSAWLAGHRQCSACLVPRLLTSNLNHRWFSLYNGFAPYYVLYWTAY